MKLPPERWFFFVLSCFTFVIAAYSWALSIHSKKLCTVNKAKSSVKTRSVTIINRITRESQAKQYLGTHYPSLFKITINKQPLDQGSKKQVTLCANELLLICYEYSFMQGQFTGAKEVAFQLQEGHSSHTLTFSWEDQSRLKLSHAKVVSTKEIYKKWAYFPL